MPVRLSGMVSGMDTETLVTALVSGYQLKKDNLVKAQTKLSWKQEKWKTMNTSIYSFYSGKLSAGRFSNAYNLKKATASKSSVATVTASTTAVTGNQSLKVNQLASSGYLTGGEIKAKDDSKVTGSSKVSDITGLDSGSFTLTVNGKASNIQITDGMTVNGLVVKLKEAGVQASFDENNQRFFVSSQTSGAAGDFSITANDLDGVKALKELGLLAKPDTDGAGNTTKSKEQAEYERLAGLKSDINAYNKELESMYTKVTAEQVAQSYADKYNEAKKALDTITSNDTWSSDKDVENSIKATESKLNEVDTENKYYYDRFIKKNANGTNVIGDDNKPVYESEDKMKEIDATLYAEYVSDTKNLESNKAMLADYTKYSEIIENTQDYVSFNTDDSGKKIEYPALADTTNEKVLAEVSSTNDALKEKAKNLLDSKIAMAEASSSLTDADYSSGAVRKIGQDSEIVLNGATFTSNTNNYSINGLTIQVTAKTDPDEEITITTETDVDGIYKSIKDMFTEYNKLIKSMDEAYNADSSKGYEPLTDDEKEAMTDKEIEKWEDKIKTSLLRKDGTLSGIIDTLKNTMASSININGKNYALSSFGIATMGYFASGDNEKGVYHIDGDPDDTTSSGNNDKLRAMIASDPETVVTFFSKLCDNLYTQLGNKMATSSISSAFTVYNDKQMNIQYSEYNTKITEAENKVTTWEDYYYKKFSAMESALSKLDSQTSSLSGLFGS